MLLWIRAIKSEKSIPRLERTTIEKIELCVRVVPTIIGRRGIKKTLVTNTDGTWPAKIYRLFSPNTLKIFFMIGILLIGKEIIAKIKKPSTASTYIRSAFL